MWWHSCVVALLVLASGGAGCSLGGLARDEIGSALARQRAQRPRLARAYGSGLEQRPRVRRVQAVTRTASVSMLEDLIARALEHNRALQAERERARAAAERVAQRISLPDPVLGATLWPTPVRTAEGDSYATVTLRQNLPLPQRLDARGRQALAQARAALWAVEQRRREIVAEVKRRFFEVYVIDRSVDVTEDNLRLLGGLLGVVRAQVVANRRTQDDLLRLQVEMSMLEAELVRLRERRAVAVARLNAVLGRPAVSPLAETPRYEVGAAAGLERLALDRLLRLAERAQPALQRARQRVEAAEQGLALARLAYWPDLQLGLGWMQMSPRSGAGLSRQGRDNVSVSLGLNVPIWFGRLRAGVREARAALEAAERGYQWERDRVGGEIEGALERVRAQRELVVLFGDSVVPQAREAYQVSQASYVAGRHDFVYVIDAWRRWLASTLQYYRALGALGQAVAELERAVGVSLPELEGGDR